MLKTSLLGDELREKVYVTLSFLFSVRVFKPWCIVTEIKVSDSIDVGAKESFENLLPHVLFIVFLTTEWIHVKNGDGRAALDDLSK